MGLHCVTVLSVFSSLSAQVATGALVKAAPAAPSSAATAAKIASEAAGVACGMALGVPMVPWLMG